MAIRETVTASRPRHRQRVRHFALIWTGITLLFGALTFIAIYAATGVVASRGIAPASITTNTEQPQPTTEGAAVLAIAQVTATTGSVPPATNTTSNATPTEVAAAPKQADTPAGPAPTVAPIKDNDFDLGIAVQENADPNTFAAWTSMVGEQLKLNWIKLQIVWHDVEREKGKIDFGALDVELPMLNKANIKIMLSIAKAPDWARDKGAKTKPDPNGDLHDGPPADPQDMANFITAILKRYPNMVHAIEVWNEINLDREWTTAPQRLDPARYVTMLQIVHDTIKAIDPNIVVISASLSPVGASNDGRYIDDFAYMDQLIKAGMLKYADCVGAHHNGINVPPDADFNNIPRRKVRFSGPWDNPNHSWAFKTTLETYAKKVSAAGSNLKLCVTEFGWPSTDGMDGKVRQGFEFASDNTLADQANFTDKALSMMQQWGFIRLAFLWNLNYAAQGGFNLQGPVGDNVAWSILGKNFQPRPVWQKIVDRNFRGQPRKASQ
jgi:polysaccharide biosynthesis protein PslG